MVVVDYEKKVLDFDFFLVFFIKEIEQLLYLLATQILVNSLHNRIELGIVNGPIMILIISLNGLGQTLGIFAFGHNFLLNGLHQNVGIVVRICLAINSCVELLVIYFEIRIHVQSFKNGL